MNQLREAGAMFVPLVREGDASALLEFFHARVARWPHPVMHDECFTTGLFDDLFEHLAPAIAFRLLPAAAAIVLRQSDRQLVACAFALLLDLARASDTTELPSELEQVWTQLHEIGQSDPSWTHLQRWYRRVQAVDRT